MDIKGFQGYQGYKEQGINDLSQEELLLLLYDELVKRLIRADLALKKEDYPVFEASVDRSLDIIRYLDDTLDMQYPISRNLNRLYDFFSYELRRVKAGRNKTELDRVRTMVSDLRETFRTARKNVEAEAAGAGAGEG
ncbi:MAG: flagellar protein FliS [Lawsonibacter sp.]|nr:flagellar protein FliS [Lawsonibacter sp.]